MKVQFIPNKKTSRRTAISLCEQLGFINPELVAEKWLEGALRVVCIVEGKDSEAHVLAKEHKVRIEEVHEATKRVKVFVPGARYSTIVRNNKTQEPK